MSLDSDNARRLAAWEATWQSGPPDIDEMPDEWIEDEVNEMVESDPEWLLDAIESTVANISKKEAKALSAAFANEEYEIIGSIISEYADTWLREEAEERINEREAEE